MRVVRSSSSTVRSCRRKDVEESKADHRTSTYTTPHLAKLRMHEMPLWLPKSYQDLNDLPSENIVYQPKLGGSKVVRTAPGVVIKYRGDLAEEVNCLNFARDHLSIRVPRVLHHPGDVRQSTLWDPRTEELPQVWYICMEEIQGVQLKEVIDSFTPLQLEHVASQIKAILADMHSVPAPHIGSVSGGPFQNSYFFPYAVKPQNAWTKVSDFIDHYHQLLMTFGTEEYAKELLANFPQDCPVNFTHGDLVPRNILVEGSTITGIQFLIYACYVHISLTIASEILKTGDLPLYVATKKDVYLQAHGHNFDGRERHVVIHWVNGTLADNPVTQIVQLSGIRGKFVFDSLVAKLRNPATLESHTQYYLGSFTRAERQLLLRLANEIEFDKTSVINGCRVWMRELLLKMVREKLISEETFEVIEEDVPLPKRMPEPDEAIEDSQRLQLH
ncbi:hypothetical protein LENED_007431 [Lentinula edodes]|uniref:Aminoglycoside phosphotransferase domain-containing protein n=1 Tax=Lentinula edodes TaxID=5353 RepID=A0A1Q3EEH0_LENED|nr:hypothetical protein LENED_007431 [Lentinula edodes]